MSEFILRREDAEAEALNVVNQADHIQETIDNLQLRLEGLEASLKGQTQVAFQAKMSQLHATETQVMLALTELGTFLTRAAATFSDADAEAAAALQV